ncbi:MAG: efflux RND transporter permease subunit [Bacteroidales bacterium]|nr:efflux RND transporter permease subunit [Bacteroidales bacterium]
MSTQHRTSSFSILVVSMILMIIGAALVPRLPVHLQPSQTTTSLSIRYSWPNATPRLVEQEVTAPLEGLLNTIRGITKITSESGNGIGTITLAFDKNTDMDAMRFEVASKIREIFPKLPERVSYPTISSYSSDTEEKTLLTYTLNAPASPRLIKQYAEEIIKPKLSNIEGLYEIDVYGATPMEWELEYDEERLQQSGLSRNNITQALNTYFSKQVIGMGYDSQGAPGLGSPKSISLETIKSKDGSWKDIPVAVVEGRLLRISDLCKIRYVEQEPTGYYRINGNNTINLVFTAEKDANSLQVADHVKKALKELSVSFPNGYFMLLSNDSTEFIRDEIQKILRRTLFSFGILMLFVLITSHSLRYLLIIFVSLISNLLIAAILVYIFKVEINLYSMAGITVSLGIIIDNTIIMVDHLRTKGNRKVFLAILASTATTIGALSVIRFMGEKLRMQLMDFSAVMVLSLTVSMIVALFLVPALMEMIGLKAGQQNRRPKSLRLAAKFNRIYQPMIEFSQRRRWIFIVLAILIFGLPIGKLPTKMEGEKWYHKLYQHTLASETYVQKIKPVSDKVLGGTLRLFTTKVYSRYKFRDPERTAINISVSLPQGATLRQMNDLMVEVERYLKDYEQIDQFVTSVSSARRAYMTINFKPEYEMGAFPFVLYSQLNDLANKLTAPDWNIQGVGQYFSNSLAESVGSQQIHLLGYNYEELMKYAEQVRNKAAEHPRASKFDIVSTQSGYSYWGYRDPLYEYVIFMDPQKLKLNQISPAQVYSYLRGYGINQSSDTRLFVNGSYEPVRMKSKQSDDFDIWMMGNTPIKSGESLIRLDNLGERHKEGSNKVICKENQQYRLTVAYDFIGATKLADLHRERVVDEVAATLPLGFSIKKSEYRAWQQEKNRQFLLILLVIVIIYLICSILLESLIQPLAVVAMIPISFVGLFLTFYLFDLSIDQGGFAAFILLSGIVVNAALYILSDYNHYMKDAPRNLTPVRLYIKSYQGKIIPITLTVLATVLGLVPFITEGDQEVFWFALAAGTMGGLIFSVLAIMIFMPAFLPLKPKHRKRFHRLKK